MNDVFSANGLLQKLLPDYEYRKEQLIMADFIEERLCDHEIAFIEAGTGTGKTLAYLVPVIFYALENDKKVALSTETKALQKQLVDKELPLIEKLIKEKSDKKFKYSLCLGGWNYPCLKRFESLINKGSFSRKDIKSIEKIENLFSRNMVFTFFDIKVSRSIWSDINRESEACNTFRCKLASKCVYLRARREWSESNILIMNHYLYFSNLASGKTYLPQCDIAVFDEAHSIKEIAAQQLGFEIQRDDLFDIFSQFSSSAKRNLINYIDDEKIKERINEIVPSLMQETDRYFNMLRSFINPPAMYQRLKEILPHGNDVIKNMKSLMLILSDIDENSIEEHHKLELDIARGRLFLFTENLNIFINQLHEDYVYWIERGGKALIEDISIKYQPVDVAEIIGPDVFSYNSCFFLSATLAIEKDFTFIASHLGVHDYSSLALDSSFDYQTQAILYIDKTLNEPGDKSYISKAADRSVEIITSLNGNCLMLFTSYKMLRDVKQLIMDKIDMSIYSQDEMASAAALESFISSENTILMGTHSFWQGIDLPGDLLRGVIMMRLPFSVPDSPVMEAKIERITNSGGNPFYALQVPEAVLKFKQGFGRLIRRRTDKGIIAVLDSRVINKSYGKHFLKSIPECSVVYSINDLFSEYGRILKE